MLLAAAPIDRSIDRSGDMESIEQAISINTCHLLQGRLGVSIHQPIIRSSMATPPAPDAAPAAPIVDAYTHYAPKALAQYLEECSGKPLVFAKVG